MGLENYIETAISQILKNPILGVLHDIKIAKILKQSNFIKRDVGYAPYQILQHFVYMLLMSKRQSSFVKQSDDAYAKDTYYRFIKQKRYNWRKLLLMSAIALMQKVRPLHKHGAPADHR